MNLPLFPLRPNSPKRIRRNGSSAIAQSHNSGIEQELTEWLGLSHSDRALLLRQQAFDRAQQGDLAQAIDLFTLLISGNPSSASNFNNRGLLHFQQGDYELALADYNQALRLNPQLAKVYNNRANCYAAMGELEAAIDDYDTAIDLDPTDVRARLNQGITFRQLELFELAIECFELAIQFSQLINATDTMRVSSTLEGHLYAERGRTYHLLGDWNCAIADYHRALLQLPLNGERLALSQRLRKQVKNWMEELLGPLQPVEDDWQAEF